MLDFEGAFRELARLADEARQALVPELEKAAELAERSLRSGGKILALGNGGSAAQAQHFTAELVGRFERNRAPMAAVSLTTDTSALTAIANDYGFDTVFDRQVEALARPGDLVVALSTSGNSPNVLAAVARARETGCAVVALTGHSGGKLAGRADALLAVPSESIPRIQEIHEVCLHLLAGRLEARLFGEEKA